MKKIRERFNIHGLLAGALFFGMTVAIPHTIVHATELTATTEIATTEVATTEQAATEAITESLPETDNNLTTVKIKPIDIVSKKSMKLTWEKKKDADGYIIFRKNGTEDWKEAGECKGGQKNSYVDEDLTYKNTYAYVVVPYQKQNGSKVYAAPNGEGMTKKLAYYSEYKKGLKYYYGL